MRRFLLMLLKLALLAGVLALALTPVVKDQLRLRQMAGAVADYRRAVEAAGPAGLAAMPEQFRAADAGAAALADPYGDEATEASDAGLPDICGNGLLAVLEIPKLGATLPVWRDGAAQPGARHMAGTGLMIGDAPSRCGIAVTLSGLDRLSAGDHLRLSALGERVDCEVVQVSREDAASMAWPRDDAGWLALVARDPSDPKGRLLVLARRVEPQALTARDDTYMAAGWIASLALAAPVALAGLVLLTLAGGLSRWVRRGKVKRMRL